MSDVFISYSRADAAFVAVLHEALKARNRECWIDWNDIPPVADWLEEIYMGITGADNFVFVISPEPVGSSVCLEEIKHAHSSGKRLVPIVCRDTDPARVPSELAKLNFIFFRGGENFDQAFEKPLLSLDTDLEWKRSQTRFLLRAAEWKKHDRDASFLMRGKELATAEGWLENTPFAAPAPSTDRGATARIEGGIGATGELREFIEQSVRARTESREEELRTSRAVSKADAEEQARIRKTRSMVKTKHLLLGPLAAAVFFSVSEIESFSGKTAPYVISALLLLSIVVSWMYLVSERCFGDGTTARAVKAELGQGASAFAGLALFGDYLLLAAIYLGSAKNYLEYNLEYWLHPRSLPPGSNYAVTSFSFVIFAGVMLIVGFALRKKPVSFWANALTALAAVWVAWAFYSTLVKGVHLPAPYTLSAIHLATEQVRVVGIGSIGQIFIFFAPFAASLFLLPDEYEARRTRMLESPLTLSAIRWQLIRSICLRAFFPILAAFSASGLVPDSARTFAYSGTPMLGGALYMTGPPLFRILFASLVAVTAVASLMVACAVTTKSAGTALEEALEAIGIKSYLAIESSGTRRRHIVWGSLFLLEIGLLVLARGRIDRLVELFSFGFGSACILKGTSIILFAIRQRRRPEAAAESGARIRTGTILVVAIITVLVFVLLIDGLLTRKAMITAPLFSALTLSVLLISRQFRSRLKREAGTVEIG
jgi:hypothetical protein